MDDIHAHERYDNESGELKGPQIHDRREREIERRVPTIETRLNASRSEPVFLTARRIIGRQWQHPFRDVTQFRTPASSNLSSTRSSDRELIIYISLLLIIQV